MFFFSLINMHSSPSKRNREENQSLRFTLETKLFSSLFHYSPFLFLILISIFVVATYLFDFTTPLFLVFCFLFSFLLYLSLHVNVKNLSKACSYKNNQFSSTRSNSVVVTCEKEEEKKWSIRK